MKRVDIRGVNIRKEGEGTPSAVSAIGLVASETPNPVVYS